MGRNIVVCRFLMKQYVLLVLAAMTLNVGAALAEPAGSSGSKEKCYISEDGDAICKKPLQNSALPPGATVKPPTPKPAKAELPVKPLPTGGNGLVAAPKPTTPFMPPQLGDTATIAPPRPVPGQSFGGGGEPSTGNAGGSCSGAGGSPTQAVGPPAGGGINVPGSTVLTSTNPTKAVGTYRNWSWESSGRRGGVGSLGEGGFYYGGILRYGRVLDPDDPSKYAFTFTISKDEPVDSFGSIRSEHGNWSATGVPNNRDVWVVWAMRLPDLSCTPGGDAQVVFQLHWDADGTENNPPLGLYFGNGNTLRFRVSHNQTRPAQQQNSVDMNYFFEQNTPVEVWQYYVMKAKFSHQAGDNPYVKVWRSVGTGAPQLIIDKTGPNTYNSPSPMRYPKEGLYHWGGQGFGGALTRTRYSKGVHVIIDEPGLNENTFFNFLGQI